MATKTTSALFFGDSLMLGTADHLGLGGIVGRIGRDLWPHAPGLRMYNLGVAGDTSTKLRARMHDEIERRRRDNMLVVIWIGINDAAIVSGTEFVTGIRTFSKNVRECIKMVPDNAPVFVMGLHTIDEERANVNDWGWRYLNAQLRDYSKDLQAVAKATGATFVPVAEALGRHDLAKDGLHITAEGYRKLFKHMQRPIRQAVDRLIA